MTGVISISDDASNDLKSLKSEKESFSDVIKLMTKSIKKKRLLDMAGAWEDSPELDKIFKGILEERHKTKEII